MADDLLPAGVIQGWYGKSAFVTGKATNETNQWGVPKPKKVIHFEYKPADMGAGCINCEGKKVCGASMTSDGFGRWAVPAATDIPEVLNMTLKNARQYCDYLEKTNEKVFDQTATIAKELAITEEKLGVLSKGIESDGVHDVVRNLQAVQAKIESLEAEVAKGTNATQKLQTSVQQHEDEVMLLAKNLAGQKDALEASAQGKMVTAADLEKFRSEMDKRHAELDEQVKKKCECVMM